MLHPISQILNKCLDAFFSDGFDTSRNNIMGLIGFMGVYTFSPLSITALKVAGAAMMAIVSSILGNLGKDIYQRYKKKYGWFDEK